MLDIKMIRTDGEKVKERIRKREMNLDSIVDEILDIDKKRRELTGEVAVSYTHLRAHET